MSNGIMYYVYYALFVGWTYLKVLTLFPAYTLLWWTDTGWRRCQKYPRKPAKCGWARLITPRRCIYLNGTDCDNNNDVKLIFHDVFNRKKEKIRGVFHQNNPLVEGKLNKGEKNPLVEAQLNEVKYVLDHSDFYQIYRRETCFAGGWAQTQGPESPFFVLGLEPEYKVISKYESFLGKIFRHYTWSAVGHELVHVAQEVREKAIRVEWNHGAGPTFSHVFRIEREAHLTFFLWPLSYAVGFVILILGLIILNGQALKLLFNS